MKKSLIIGSMTLLVVLGGCSQQADDNHVTTYSKTGDTVTVNKNSDVIDFYMQTKNNHGSYTISLKDKTTGKITSFNGNCSYGYCITDVPYSKIPHGKFDGTVHFSDGRPETYFDLSN